jgi:hypothetical protein
MTSPSMRRASICLTVLSFAVLGLAGTASATPTVTSFKIEALPIPGFPGTGDILGAGAVIKGEVAISGSEYDGSPPPLTGLKFFAPAGTKFHPQGFATCAPSVLEQSGPSLCPKQSIAGPKGFSVGIVTFGGERVPEMASVQPFFAPGGQLVDFVDGTTPVLIEILATAHVVGLSPPFGVGFIGEIPLIETLPGAPDASFEEGAVSVGSAYKQGKTTISYITMPRRCPRGGFPAKLEMSFLGGATTEAPYKMPCPKK